MRSAHALVGLAGLSLLVAACDTNPVRQFIPPPMDNVRSTPADAYPNINVVRSRPSQPRTPAEVAEAERELERLRESHSAPQ